MTAICISFPYLVVMVKVNGRQPPPPPFTLSWTASNNSIRDISQDFRMRKWKFFAGGSDADFFFSSKKRIEKKFIHLHLFKHKKESFKITFFGVAGKIPFIYSDWF